MTIPRPRSLYDVLNVSPEAEPVVIEAAYKALIKKYHPDQAAEAGALSPDAADLNKAFAVLKDPGRRAEYDHRLWVRDQAIRAAAARPDPPRSRFVGAAGWFAAIMLGGVIAAMAIGREAGTPPPLRSAAAGSESRAGPGAAAARDAGPDFLSQEQADADVAAMAEIGAGREPPPPPPQLRIVEETAPAAPAAPRYVQPQRYAAPAPPPPRRRPPPARPRTPEPSAEDAEFLERQGYIY